MRVMRRRENIIAAGLSGAVLLSVAALFLGTHYRALLHPGAAASNAVAEENPYALHIPTIDEMCKAVGATNDNLASCKNDEGAAAEFVIAWMGLHGFVANGDIDISLIQLAEDLGTDAASPLIDPDVSLADPSLSGDLSFGGDPSAAETGTEPNIDPATGIPVTDSFESPAQIAKFCLGDSMDWLQLHDCISRYDPTSRFDGN
jgi:hypothetical protein